MMDTGVSNLRKVKISDAETRSNSETDTVGARSAITFRQFTLLPLARVLLRDQQPVEIGSRAFDLLHVLAAARGAVVTKSEILRRVWPGTIVEEGNLRFQVSVLRRALGSDGELIRTVAGRGYLLAQEIPEAPATLAVGDRAPSGSPSGVVRDPQDGRVLQLISSAEIRAALRDMLRAALDELWQMASGDPAATSSHVDAHDLTRKMLRTELSTAADDGRSVVGAAVQGDVQ